MNPSTRSRSPGCGPPPTTGCSTTSGANGQLFVIDVTVGLDFRDAALSDDLDRTIHYGELAEEVVAAVERDPVDLIETVAERVAAVVLAHDRARGRDRHGAQAGRADRRALRGRLGAHRPRAPRALPARRIRQVTASTLGDHRHRQQPRRPRGDDPRRRARPRRPSRCRRHRGIRSRRDRGAQARRRRHGCPRLPQRGRRRRARSSSRTHCSTALTGIEAAHGRVREDRWGDRTLDLDIIVFGGQRIDSPGLTLPHPRAGDRDFVLGPWLAGRPGCRAAGPGPHRRAHRPDAAGLSRGAAAVTRTRPLTLVLLAAFGATALWFAQAALAASGRPVLIPPFTLGDRARAHRRRDRGAGAGRSGGSPPGGRAPASTRSMRRASSCSRRPRA